MAVGDAFVKAPQLLAVNKVCVDALPVQWQWKLFRMSPDFFDSHTSRTEWSFCGHGSGLVNECCSSPLICEIGNGKFLFGAMKLACGTTLCQGNEWTERSERNAEKWQWENCFKLSSISTLSKIGQRISPNRFRSEITSFITCVQLMVKVLIFACLFFGRTQ